MYLDEGDNEAGQLLIGHVVQAVPLQVAILQLQPLRFSPQLCVLPTQPLCLAAQGIQLHLASKTVFKEVDRLHQTDRQIFSLALRHTAAGQLLDRLSLQGQIRSLHTAEL